DRLRKPNRLSPPGVVDRNNDEDDIPLPQPVPLVREEAIHKNARMLNEIWGRQGLGPVDWKALASRISVPITLMEL
ncbi:hypothetical protein E4U15_003083, partial [Claviceps sp. LM218 group G6]